MRSPTIRLDRRIYADQDGGCHAYVIDGASMKVIGMVVMPADDLESPSINPKTGTLYQNLANGGGFAIVDPATLHVFKVVDTPQLTDNHAPVFAPEADQVLVAGKNGILSAYTPDGVLVEVSQFSRISISAAPARRERSWCARAKGSLARSPRAPDRRRGCSLASTPGARESTRSASMRAPATFG